MFILIFFIGEAIAIGVVILRRFASGGMII